MRKIDADNFKKALKEYQEYGEKEIKKWIEQKKYRNADRCSFMVEATKDIIKGLDKQPTLDDWIPVEKGLPKKKEEVLTTCQFESYDSKSKKYKLHKCRTVGQINHYGEWEVDAEHECGWGLGENNKVLAWQPLPDEYEGE